MSLESINDGVILVSGYPGAGKSTVGDMIENLISNAVHIESGTIVREKYREEKNITGNIDSHKLGKWIDRKVSKNETYVADLTLNKAKQIDKDIVVVSGLREEVAHKMSKNMFENYDSIFIDATFKNRLKRMRKRGREGEDSFDEEDLTDRDNREIGWGIEDIREISNHEIENNNDINYLSKKVSNLNFF